MVYYKQKCKIFQTFSLHIVFFERLFEGKKN
jgi:hypothetical protein